METAEHLDALVRQGTLLIRDALRAGWDAPVPTCPGWAVRDLVRHQGGVHRWTAAVVRERRTERMDPAEKSTYMDLHPEHDADLAGWFTDGLDELRVVLADAAEADPVPRIWTFGPADTAPDAPAFWARRQAHETAMHRVDAGLAAGVGLAELEFEYGADFAADGIAELVDVYVERFSRVRAERERTLLVAPDDAALRRVVTIGPDGIRAWAPGPGETAGGDTKADTVVSGRSAPLLLALWSRAAFEPDAVHGDHGVVAFWGETVRVVWR